MQRERYQLTVQHFYPPAPIIPHLHLRQLARSSTREYSHDPKAHIEQRKGICNQAPHTRHPSHNTKHRAARVCTPPNRQADKAVAQERVQGQHNTEQTRQDKRQEAVAQYAGTPADGQRGGEVSARGIAAVRVLGGVQLVLRERRRHHAEDCVEGEGTEGSEAADVAEPELAGL